MFSDRFCCKFFAFAMLLVAPFSWAVDIQISTTDVPVRYTPGLTVTNEYVVEVAKGTASGTVTDIGVSLGFVGETNGISSMTWSCSAPGASTCSSSGATTTNDGIALTVTLDSNDDVTISITSVTYNTTNTNDLDFNVAITDPGMVGGNANVDSTAGNDTASNTVAIRDEADIAISVTDGTNQYIPGTAAQYTVTVANSGPSSANNVIITDNALPAGLSITGWSCSTQGAGNSCSAVSNGTANLDLANGGTATITVNGSYASNSTTDPLIYEVQAEITDDTEYDPDGLIQIATDSDVRAPQADLEITVDTQNPAITTYVPGNSRVYQVVVTNGGPTDVAGVTVIGNDNTAGEFDTTNWTCVASAGSSCSGGTGRLNTTADLIKNGTATYTVTVAFDSAASLNPFVYTVTATNPDTAYTGTSPVNDSKSLTLNKIANLAVTLDDTVTSYVPGLGGTFTATVTNSGPSDVTGVSVVDSDLSEISAISWTCAVTDASSDCAAGSDTNPVNTTVDLVAGDSAVFSIDVTYLSSANTNPLVYQVTATNPAGVNGTSPAVGTDDNDALDRQVNITVTKTSKDDGLGQQGTYVPNEPFEYSIVVRNAGPSDLGTPEQGVDPAENVLLLTDFIDGSLLEHPTECTGGTTVPCWKFCPSDSGVPGTDISPDNCPGFGDILGGSGYEMNVGMHLSAGSSSAVKIYARIDESTGSNCDLSTPATRELCNTASAVITGSNTTHTGAANQLISSVSNEIVIGTDLIVTKDDGLSTTSPGTQVTYTIDVENDGFTDANGVTFTDMLPLYPTEMAGFIPGSISWVCTTEDDNACCISGSPSCPLSNPVTGTSDSLSTLIDLGGQTKVTYTVTGTISNQSTGTLSNTATATLPAGIDETNVDNNSDTDETVLNAESDVAVTKELIDPVPNTDDPAVIDLEYEIVVTNNGPSFATNVNIVDLLDDQNLNTSTATWSCTIQGTGDCDQAGPVIATSVDTTVNLAVGSTATLIVKVSTNPNPTIQGRIINEVTVTADGFDPVPINDSAVVEYALSGTALLRIENDDFLNTATPGLPTNYTVRVQNEGPDNVFGAKVENLFPPQLTDVEWTCSAISPIPGDLTFFQSSGESTAGTTMILSPDGSHIYIGSPDTNRLYVYERNTILGAEFGQVTLVEILTDGENAITGIEFIEEFQMSQDGAYLYALSTEPSGTTSAISTFSRNTNRLSSDFGRLTFLNVTTDQMPVNSVDILLTPDQKHIYVTGDDEIFRYSRATGTGLLNYQTSAATTVAGHMVVSSDGSNIYVVDELSDQLDAYDRDTDEASPGFGDLSKFGDVIQADIDVVADMLISGDDKSIYLAATGTDKLIVVNRDLSSGVISFAASYDDGVAGFNFVAGETLVGMNKLNISPDGQHLFVSNPVPSNANDGFLLVLSRNSQGLLSKDQKISLIGTEGLSDVVISPDGKQVLTTATDGNTLVAFDRRQPDPTFSFVEVEIDQQNDLADPAGIVDGLLGAAAVVVSRDGNHVYAASIGDNAIAVFERDKSKGATAATRGEHLIFIDSYQDGDSGISGLADVNSLAISPDGGFVFAGSRDESTLAVFSRSEDGALNFVNSYAHASGVIDGLLGISDIVVDSTSENLYVAAQFEASVAHYEINAAGGLTLVGAIANGDLGVSGLGGARALALTTDGDHLIVGSGIDDSVVVLTRAEMTGELVFQQHLPGVGDQPMDVAVSPDGEHIYVASANDSRLTVINRNISPVPEEYGQLTINTSYIDGVAGFNQMLGLRSVVVSPNGQKVYVGAEFDAAISVLDRDTNPNSPSFGRLAVVEVQKDGVDGVNGLNQLYALAVSRDSRHVYAVGFGDNALAAFVLGEGSSCSAQGSGNILDTVDIGANGTLTYAISGTIRSNATGEIVTEARILPPENFTIDTPLDNCANPAVSADDNCDQDTTALVPLIDLSISKTNGQLSAIAGDPISYEIRVSNAGPSDANSSALERVMVKDVLNNGFEPGSASWTCDAVGSGSLKYLTSIINEETIVGTNDTVTGLAGVSSLAYANNLAGFGPHVVATSVVDNGLLAFSIDVLSGELTQVLPVVTAGPGISLNGARDVLVIDNDVYVASQVDDALVAFKAAGSTGLELQWVQNHEGFGLNQAVSVTASDNGAHVYVTGANDNSVVIFSRNLGNGTLTYFDTVSGPGQGLSGVNALAISADGYSAYTSGYNDNEIGRYQRDLVTGALTFVEVLDLPGVVFNAVSAIAISADGNHVYVTSAGNNRIYVFARDTSALPESSDYGLLTPVQTIEQGVGGVNGLLKPSDVMLSTGVTDAEKGRHVYISSEQSDAVLWFARNAETGTLVYGGIITDLVSSVDGLNGAIALASDDNGQYIYVAGSQDNGIAVLTRSADSFCPASGVGNIAEMVGGVEAGVEVDLAVNGQLIFTVNATVAANATGTLLNKALALSCELPLNPSAPVPPLDPLDPFDPLEDCSGSDTESTNNSAVDIDALNPTADLMITKSDGVSIYEGLSGAKQVAGDDQFVYVAATQDNAITMFKRQASSGNADFGLLSYLGQRKNGENGVSGLLSASDVVLSADGKTLYASGSGDNSVVVFRKSANGQLTYIEKQTSGVFGVTGIEGVSALNLSADGAHLYATGPLTNSLAVFAVDQSGGTDHGKLTFIQSLQNAVDGVAGLANASDVLVSSDNMHVYVTSESANAVSLFLRNPNDASVSYGQLSYQLTYTNGSDGIGGLLGAKKMIMDDSDEYLYILGPVSQALVVFSRDATTGELTFVQFKQNGFIDDSGEVVGLNLARDLILSADQQSLYVAGRGENALIRFNRNSADGTLDFADATFDGDPLALPGTFVNGLSGAAGLHMSGDDQHLYVVADQDSSVSVFNRDDSIPAPDLGMLSLSDVLINGRGGVAPGTELTYLIVASNAGPSDVENARVVDIFPPEFENISYQCFPVNGAGCNTSLQNGNVNEVVDLPVGSSVEIRATGVIRSDASGVISNTATVAPSTDPLFTVSDPDVSNNSATDDDTVLFVATDLKVTKDNGVTTLVPGDAVTYTIRVANDSVLPGNSIPSDVSGVMVTDLVPEAISDVSWSCQAFPDPGLLDDGDGNPSTDNYVSFTDLDLFNDMVVHPNGDLAYVVGVDAGESTVLVYERDSRSGALTELQRIGASNPTVSGLDGALALRLSPDNRQLYVISNVEDSISTWLVDPSTGEITFDDVLIDGLSGVNGLGGANDVLVSADGINVYVAGKADNAIAIFDRNIGSGQLTFNSFLTGVEGLSGVHALTQYDRYIVAVSESNQSVATFTRSVQNGLLVSADVIQDFEIPGSVLESPRDVVVVNDQVLVASYGSDALSIFSLDTDDGSLGFTGAIRQGDAGVTGLEGPESIKVSPSGTELYVASSTSEAIMLFVFDGVAYQPSSLIYDTTLIADLDGVNQVVMNSRGTHLYALSDELVLTKVQNGSSCTASGQGALNDMADIVSMGYVEYTLTGTILPTATGLLRNTATALMTGDSVELNAVDNEDFDEDTLVPTSDLSISKDDGLLQVVAGTSLEYDISVFSAGPSAMNVIIEDLLPIFPMPTAGFETQSALWACSTGRTLQENGIYTEDGTNGLASGSAVIESPDGQYVYVLSGLGTLSVFSKDTSGMLSLVQLINEADELDGGEVNGLLGAKAAAMDSEGQNVYVVSQTGNQLLILSRDQVTGVLDYQDTLTSGTNGISGMLGPVAIHVAPDDAGVYVAANDSDAITVFSRDLTDGGLTFVERVRDGFGTIVPESNVIIEITDLVLSSDGEYLYTSADFSEAVAVFSRDPNTQTLTFEAVIRAGDVHGSLTVPAMSGPQAMAITNNGDYIYTVVQGSSSLMRFKRNSTDGSLEFESQLLNGDLGAGSLESPNDLELTPNGGKLLVTDLQNNILSVYERNTTSGELTLVDEFNVNVEEVDLLANPVSISTDGINVFVVLNQQDRLLAVRITADAECQLGSELTDTPLIPLYMSPGSAAQIQIGARVHPSARGIINNVARVILSPDSMDNNLTNNEAFDDDTEILVQTDVSIEKTGPTEAIAGEVIEYQLTLTNTGPSDALGVVVNDSLPAALLNATWTCTSIGSSTCSNASGSGDLSESVNVTVDGGVTLVVTALIDPSFNGSMVNQVNAVAFEEGFNTDTDLDNNNDEVTTLVTQVADLSVVKTNSTSEVVAGEPTSYQIVVSNAGPSDGNAVVVDMMPESLSQVTWLCSAALGSSCAPTGQGDINQTVNVAPNSEIIYQVDAWVDSSAVGQVVNEVMVDAINPVTDPDLLNNISSDVDDVTQIADLEVTLIDLIDPYDPASPIDLPFSLSVINLGPSDASNVEVNLPLQLDVTADTVNVCSVSASGVNCDIGYSPAGEVHEFIVNYRLNPALTGEINNLAEASSETFDPDLNNNTDSTVTDLISGIDVRVSQSNGHDEVEPGQTLTYEIVVENIGSVDAGEVNIDEQLPTGLINASWQCEAYDGAACLNINETGVTGGADLPSGGRVVMTLIATVDPALTDMSQTQISNTVEAVLISETDYNLLNNVSTDTDPLIFFIFRDGFDGVVR